MGEQINNVFERIEKKYLLPEDKFNLLFQKIEPYVSIDKFDLHTISNIYYDSETFDLIRNSMEKPSYKEKLRLKSYGIPLQLLQQLQHALCSWPYTKANSATALLLKGHLK